MKSIGKKILLVLAGLALLVTAVLGVAVWRARDLVNLLKPALEEKLSAALGAPVQLGEVSLSIFPSCSVLVRDLRVRGDGGTSNGPSLERLAVDLELLPLLRRELKVSSVQLDGPRVTLLRGASGITVAGLPPRGKSKPSQTTPAPATSTSPTPNAASSAAPALALELERITLVRGEIVLRDELNTAGPGAPPLTLRQVALSARVTSSGEQVRISSLKGAAALTDTVTLKLTGDELTFEPSTSALTLKGGSLALPAGELRAAGTLTLAQQRGAVTFSVQSLALEQLKDLPAFGPLLTPYNLSGTLATQGDIELRGPQQIKVQATANLAQVNATLPQKRQLQGLAGAVTLAGTPTELTLSSEKLTGTVDTTPLEVALTAQLSSPQAAQGAHATLKLSRLTINAFGGQTEAPFTLTLQPPLHLSTSPRASALDITKLSALVQPQLAQRLSGTIQSLEGSLVGPLTGKPPQLRGRGNTTITNAVIKGVNLAQLVLASVKGIPLIEEALLARVPPEFEPLLREPDTRIQRATTGFEFSPQGVEIRTLTLTSEIFELTANGQIAPDGDLTLRATITFSEQFSRALAARVKRLENILTPPGQLIVPLQIRGIAPRLVVVPDLKGLMQTGAGKVIEREAERAIDKAFGKGSSRSNGVKDALRGLLGK